MKKAIVAILIGAVLLGTAVLGGKALYHHFVTLRVTDRDGMENPDYTEELRQEDDGSTDITE